MVCGGSGWPHWRAFFPKHTLWHSLVTLVTQAFTILELVDLWLCSIVVRYCSELKRDAERARDRYHKAHHFVIYIPSLCMLTPRWMDVEVNVREATPV